MISSPYKGLRPFDDSDLDALLFFGRDRDAQVIEANVLASRFTVLYGASGVGKSSVLRARVVRELRALPERPAVAVFSAWSDDAIAGIAGAVAEAAGVEAEATLAGTLAAATDARREVYLILDQAEELFLYEGAVHDVVLDLPEAAAAPGVRVNVLLAIRDDAVALLDRFKRRLPDLLSNTLRLDRLDHASARLAVVGPLAAYARLGGEGPSEAEDELVERVLDEVGAGRIRPALAGVGGVTEPGAGIEAPYLQLVLQRLWDVERDAGSTVLRAQTLARLGGAQRIVADHLESAVGALDEEGRNVAASAFRYLVTPSGTKIAYDVPDLAGYAGVAEPALLPVLDELADRRILRTVAHGGANGVPRFEIFHDVLADAVLAWRARHVAGTELRAEREEARRRYRNAARFAGAALVALVVVGAVAIYALTQREEARAQARAAEARAIAAAALERLPFDPELGLILALQALDREQTPQTEGVLRQALLASRVRDVERVGKTLTAASQVGADIVVTTSDGAVRVGPRTVVEGGRGVRSHLQADRAVTVGSSEVRVHSLPAGALVLRQAVPDGTRVAETTHDGARTVVARGPRTAALLDRDGRLVTSLGEAGDVVAAAFSRGGRLLATASRDRIARIWNAEDGRLRFALVGHVGQITDVAFSPRGTLVATASTDGTARIWTTSGSPVAVLVGHVGSVDDVEFSPDGFTVATGGEDRTARVWKADTGGPVALLAGHSEPVVSVAFNRSGRRVVTASEDGTVRTWDPVDQRELVVVADLGRPVTRADVAREAGIDAAPDAGIRIDGEVVRVAGTTLRGHRDVVNTARRSRDGRFVVTSSRDHRARIFDTASGQLLRTLIGHSGAVGDASFSPDGRWVVTAGPSTAGLWDAAGGELVFLMRGHRGLLSAAAFAASGDRIVTGGVDGTIRAHRCRVCAPAAGLVALARERLEHTGRTLTADERLRFLP
jgi:WD40 repeat protein